MSVAAVNSETAVLRVVKEFAGVGRNVDSNDTLVVDIDNTASLCINLRGKRANYVKKGRDIDAVNSNQLLLEVVLQSNQQQIGLRQTGEITSRLGKLLDYFISK